MTIGGKNENIMIFPHTDLKQITILLPDHHHHQSKDTHPTFMINSSSVSTRKTHSSELFIDNI